MSERAGFTTPNLMEAETNRALVDAAERLVVLADHTKWGTVGISSIAALDEAHVVVTDGGLPDAAPRRPVASTSSELHPGGSGAGEANGDHAGRRPGADLLRRARRRRPRPPSTGASCRRRRRRPSCGTTRWSTSGWRSPRTGRAAPSCRPATSARCARRARDRLTEIPAADYDVVVFENRFPSFSDRVGEPVEAPTPYSPVRPGAGRCEVVCFTSDHDASFAGLPADAGAHGHGRAGRPHRRAVRRCPSVEQVFCFENRGVEIGVTLHHPHGQIYAYPFVTPRTRRDARPRRGGTPSDRRAQPVRRRARRRARGRRAGGRGATSTGRRSCRRPPAGRSRCTSPRTGQVPDMPALDDAERDAFARRSTWTCCAASTALFGAPMPYIAAWHQAPVRADRELGYLHLQLFSIRRAPGKLKYLAGSESAMGVFVNDVRPEQAAERLRSVVQRSRFRGMDVDQIVRSGCAGRRASMSGTCAGALAAARSCWCTGWRPTPGCGTRWPRGWPRPGIRPTRSTCAATASPTLPDDGYDTATAAADLAAVITALGLDRPVVAGQSWGGNVVVAAGRRAPGAGRRRSALVDGGWIDLPAAFAAGRRARRRCARPTSTACAPTSCAAGCAAHPDWSPAAIEATLANLRDLPGRTARAAAADPAAHGDRAQHVGRPARPRFCPALAMPALLLPAGPRPGRAARARAGRGRGRRDAATRRSASTPAPTTTCTPSTRAGSPPTCWRWWTRHDPACWSIMGSGETAPTMVKPHRAIFERVGDGPAVLLDTPYGFQSNADDISARAVGYFAASVGREVERGVVAHGRPSRRWRASGRSPRVRDAGWVFAGPGQPDLRPAAVARHADPEAARPTSSTRGGVVLFASAAALTLGTPHDPGLRDLQGRRRAALGARARPGRRG